MAIVEKRRKDGTRVYAYRQPNRDEMYRDLEEFLQIIKIYIESVTDLHMSDIKMDFALLCEIMVRIDKRKDYFAIFHDDTDISETKIASLIAYWIVKFRPFSIREIGTVSKYYAINEMLATFIILGEAKEKTKRDQSMVFNISPEYVQKLYYGIKYWDISKEAFMLAEESLSQSMRNRKLQ